MREGQIGLIPRGSCRIFLRIEVRNNVLDSVTGSYCDVPVSQLTVGPVGPVVPPNTCPPGQKECDGVGDGCIPIDDECCGDGTSCSSDFPICTNLPNFCCPAAFPFSCGDAEFCTSDPDLSNCPGAVAGQCSGFDSDAPNACGPCNTDADCPGGNDCFTTALPAPFCG